jgi:hypothetical protein
MLFPALHNFRASSEKIGVWITDSEKKVSAQDEIRLAVLRWNIPSSNTT